MEKIREQEPIFRQTNLYLDEELVMLATRKLRTITGKTRMLSWFVNNVLEEFCLEGEERPGISVRDLAREMTSKIRHEKLSQRKLLIDAETERLEKERQETQRKILIEQETRAAIRKLGFKPEWLRDPRGLNYSHHRDELTDEVSIAVRLDLQWREIYPFVAAALLEDS